MKAEGPGLKDVITAEQLGSTGMMTYVLTSDGAFLRTDFKGAVPKGIETLNQIDKSKVFITRIADVNPEFDNGMETGLYFQGQNILEGSKNVKDGLGKNWN